MTEAELISRSNETAEIWRGDLFGRRAEAELLIGYLESIYRRPSHREDARAYTVAIDAGYGEGKTFFLRRLAKHIALTHPVAFVDAWADDLADQPMTAISATLKDALKSGLDEPEVRRRWTEFMSKSGRVAKIAGIGLAKRALGTLLTAGAVEAASEILTQASEDVQDVVNEDLSAMGTGLVDDVIASSKRNSRWMEDNIAAFQAGQSAIAGMKASLSEVINSVEHGEISLPVVIIIDELDRCRPTYAIKLLEEIKHLFDVPGIIFVFGLYGEQLSHSVAGAYGSGFDGKAYLRRFFRRSYSLRKPDLTPLLKVLVESTAMETDRLAYPQLLIDGMRVKADLWVLISFYMEAYGLRPRDAFEVVDMLETCLTLAAPYNLYLPYLLPLMMAHLLGNPLDQITAPEKTFKFRYVHFPNRMETELDPVGLAQEFQNYSSLSEREFSNAYENLLSNYSTQPILDVQYRQLKGQNPFARIDQYNRLIITVGRFKNLDISDPLEG